jgi:hypothetical protein
VTEQDQGPPQGRPLEEAAYDSFDPTLFARPTAPAPAADEEPGPAGPEAPARFDERWREEFVGLLYLGALTASFTWLGHRFVLRTLRTSEYLEVSRLASEYRDTDGYAKALQAALTAASVVSVDGRPVGGVPLTTTPGDTQVEMAFRYVLDNWFPPVVDKVYEQFVLLEAQQREVLEAMGNPAG